MSISATRTFFKGFPSVSEIIDIAKELKNKKNIESSVILIDERKPNPSPESLNTLIFCKECMGLGFNPKKIWDAIQAGKLTVPHSYRKTRSRKLTIEILRSSGLDLDAYKIEVKYPQSVISILNKNI
jgi:hypothetical protein